VYIKGLHEHNQQLLFSESELAMMKHHILWGLVLLLCVAMASRAAADDLRPPDWRGGLNSTLQVWEFSDDDNTALPTFDDNPYGTAVATVYGCFSCGSPDAFWLEEHSGHSGVWNIGVAMSLDIPNDPTLRPLKWIRLQITYDGGDATPEPQPWIVVEAADGAEVTECVLVEQIPLEGGYVHDTYDLAVEPNPSNEVIWLQPHYCEIFIDQIVVDTICLSDAAPEPSTLIALLIGVVSCAVCRRRPR
jgi:hypothetical protein